jgi:hypothetical protein
MPPLRLLFGKVEDVTEKPADRSPKTMEYTHP